MSVLVEAGQVAALLAAGFGSGWLSNAAKGFRSRREQKRDEQQRIEHRNWHGYVDLGGINTWPVLLMDRPDGPSATVVLQVVDNEGAPDVNWAHSLRQWVSERGMLARPPTSEELELLKELGRERGYGKGGHPIQ